MELIELIQKNIELAELSVDATTLLVLIGTLVAVIVYTNSTIKLQKKSEEQTNAIIQQTELLKKQIELSIMPSFQLSLEDENKGHSKVFIENIGNGVGLNIEVFISFSDPRHQEVHFLHNIQQKHFPVLHPKDPKPLLYDALGSIVRQGFLYSTTTFTFSDILGNRYEQVNTIESGHIKHSYVKPA